MLDVLRLSGFLTASECEQLIREMREADGLPAAVYDRAREGAVDQRVRRVTRIVPSAATQELVLARLTKHIPEMQERFTVRLRSCDEPQFLRYRAGDFFVAHQDGNTPLIFDDSQHRRVSTVIFLNAQSDDPRPETYEGGSLMLHGGMSMPGLCLNAAGEAGSLIAFRSETTHEVTPVTRGERFTIASWYR